MRHVDHLANSGWTAFASVRSVLSDSGVPLPDGDFLREVFAPSVWKEVDHACELLESRFRDCRYSDSVSYGPLLVPIRHCSTSAERWTTAFATAIRTS